MNMFGVVEGINYLQLLETLGPLEQGEDRPLNYQVVQIQLQELSGRYSVEESEFIYSLPLDFFRVSIEEPFFIFQEDKGASSNVFGEKKGAAVSSVWRNGTYLRGVFKIAVGRNSIGYWQVAELAEHGQLFQIVSMTDLDPPVFRK